MLKLAPPSRQTSFPLRQRYTQDKPEARGADASSGLAGSPASQWHMTGTPWDLGDSGSMAWRIAARGAAGDTGSQWHMPGDPGHHLLDNPTWESESAEVHLQLLPAEAGAGNHAGQAPPELWGADMGSPWEGAQAGPGGAELPLLDGAISLMPLTRLQSRLSGLALWQAAGALPVAAEAEAEAEPEAGAQPAEGAQPKRDLLKAASQARLQRYSRRLSQRLRELAAAQQALAGQQQGPASADDLLDTWQHWAAPVAPFASLATQQGSGQPGPQALLYAEGGLHPALGHVADPALGLQVRPLSLARQPLEGSGVSREASQQLLGAPSHASQTESARRRLTRPSPAHAGNHRLPSGCGTIVAHELRQCAGVCSCIPYVCWAAWPSGAALHLHWFKADLDTLSFALVMLQWSLQATGQSLCTAAATTAPHERSLLCRCFTDSTALFCSSRSVACHLHTTAAGSCTALPAGEWKTSCAQSAAVYASH